MLVEQIYTKSGMPSIANTVGPTLFQISRTVLQVYSLGDIYIDGKLVDASSMTMWDMIKGSLGIGVTSRPSGQTSLKLEYSGFYNEIQPLPEIRAIVPRALSAEYAFDVRSPYIYGHDPLSSIRLYRNPAVTFVQADGGRSPATAIAKFNQGNHELKTLDSALQISQAIRELEGSNPALRF
ncbi:hypothetical protein FAZ69_31980 [Trinickia terrae]|uniref:Uncharacterized protein n=1 Tax=Trinickia terrae TaxID=2571161 RepID=A0A4U1HEL5_9BURK|nr:hypothetical protein [Trinickia terrae]TKC78208.1 hypothetical protein FAZ69_31980 [Trinickia terrae]